MNDAPQLIPNVTDSSLFGEAVANKATAPPKEFDNWGPPRCSRCAAVERLKTIGKFITTTLSPVLGICGRCVSKEAGLEH